MYYLKNWTDGGVKIWPNYSLENVKSNLQLFLMNIKYFGYDLYVNFNDKWFCNSMKQVFIDFKSYENQQQK